MTDIDIELYLLNQEECVVRMCVHHHSSPPSRRILRCRGGSWSSTWSWLPHPSPVHSPPTTHRPSPASIPSQEPSGESSWLGNKSFNDHSCVAWKTGAGRSGVLRADYTLLGKNVAALSMWLMSVCSCSCVSRGSTGAGLRRFMYTVHLIFTKKKKYGTVFSSTIIII